MKAVALNKSWKLSLIVVVIIHLSLIIKYIFFNHLITHDVDFDVYRCPNSKIRIARSVIFHKFLLT